MTRPHAILWFERLYLASFVVGLVSTVQSWGARDAMLAGNPATATLSWLAPVISVLGVAIALALWWLVARRGSIVGKWIVTAFAVWGAVLAAVLVYGLATGRGDPLTLLVGLLQNALYIAAATTLYRNDARAWFGESDTAEVVA